MLLLLCVFGAVYVGVVVTIGVGVTVAVVDGGIVDSIGEVVVSVDVGVGGVGVGVGVVGGGVVVVFVGGVIGTNVYVAVCWCGTTNVVAGVDGIASVGVAVIL